jgi:hypothetical protein
MVITKTERMSDDTGEGIRYRVIARIEGTNEGSVVWERRVYFGHNRRYRAGGRAFMEAAREQERQAALGVN